MTNIKKLILILFVVGSFITYDVLFLVPIDDPRMFNVFIEFSFALLLAVLFLSIDSLKGKGFYQLLNVGFFLVFVSMLVDGLDQFYYHDEMYTAVAEKSPLLLGFVLVFVGVRSWIVEHTLLNKKLENQAYTDDLTGLFNRRGMLRKFDAMNEIAKAKNLPLSLIIADLDDFKVYNDTFGHIAGDKYLAEMGQSLLAIMGKNETIGRWGGEEFAICLLGSGLDQAKQFAEKIRQSVQAMELPSTALNHPLTVSLGVAEKVSSESLMEAIKRADRALYAAKSKGKNQTVAE